MNKKLLLAGFALGLLVATTGTSASPMCSGELQPVFSRQDHVPISDGQTVLVTESWSPRALARHPRRAVLFLSGSAFRGSHFSIPVEGYNGSEILARRGFFAFTVDYLGVGESSRPADGRTASFAAQTAAMAEVVRFIRNRRGVERVDLIGDGYGGAIATQLAALPALVRSATMSAMLYDVLLGGPLSDPAVVALLEGSPDGYFFVPGEASLVFMEEAPQEAKDWVVANQGGFYPTPNFLVATGTLPFFNPGVAQVPGLVVFGPNDIVVGSEGVDNLVTDYGPYGAELVVHPQAGHAPRVEAPEIAAWYWSQVLAFLER